MTERVAALIPAFNAAKLIEPVIRESLQYRSDVFVVDDGSLDGTGEVARNAGAVVIRHEVNRGKGAALKTGFAHLLEKGFDGVITLDADGQHLPRNIPLFLEARATKGADLIIGGRSHLFDKMLPRRRMANRFSAWAIAMFSGAGVTDSQSGFRFYSARLLRSMEMVSDGFDMESEIIVRAGRAGFQIVTIPIELGFVDGVSTSHYKPVRDTLEIAWTVIKARLRG